MQITRNSVAEVAGQLSPWAIRVITNFNSDLHFEQEEFYNYHLAVLELIGRNAIRPAYDLMSHKWILVLQSGGKMLIKHFHAVNIATEVKS